MMVAINIIPLANSMDATPKNPIIPILTILTTEITLKLVRNTLVCGLWQRDIVLCCSSNHTLTTQAIYNDDTKNGSTNIVNSVAKKVTIPIVMLWRCCCLLNCILFLLILFGSPNCYVEIPV